MISAYTDPIAFDYKVCFDGYDYLQSELGREFANPLLEAWIRAHHNQHDLRFAEAFIQDCISYRRQNEPDHVLPIGLRDKYEVGLYVTSESSCFDHPYALFNKEALELWNSPESPTYGLTFLVRPSRDANGAINEIGFRILDTASVRQAFKWIFLCGQQATYGLQDANESGPLILVEGAWDQIAFAESGARNVVGLGSVDIGPGHKKFLQGREYSVCWDADTFGIAKRGSGNSRYCFYSPDGKDPFDAWLQHGPLSLVTVE